MGKDKKKRAKQTVAIPLGEYLEKLSGGNVPIYKEIGTGDSKTIMNFSEDQLAPQSCFEVTIKPFILKNGPPYPITAKNIPFDASESDVKEFLGSKEAIVELKYDESQRPTGVAVISFNDIDEFRNALEKDGFKIGSRSVQLIQGIFTYEMEQNFKRDKYRSQSSNYNRDNPENMRSSRYQNSNENQSEGQDPELILNWRDRPITTSRPQEPIINSRFKQPEQEFNLEQSNWRIRESAEAPNSHHNHAPDGYERYNRFERSDGPGRSDRPERSDRYGRSERSDKYGKPERSDRPDISNRYDKLQNSTDSDNRRGNTGNRNIRPNPGSLDLSALRDPNKKLPIIPPPSQANN